jgi:hypothetical protein
MTGKLRLKPDAQHVNLFFKKIKFHQNNNIFLKIKIISPELKFGFTKLCLFYVLKIFFKKLIF